MADNGLYTVRYNVTNPSSSATNALMQITLAARKYSVYHIRVNNESNVTQNAAVLELVRHTTTATGTLTTGGVVMAVNSRDRAYTVGFTVNVSGFTSGPAGTAETIYHKGFNTMAGAGIDESHVLYEWIEIDGTDFGFLTVRIPVFPASAGTFNFELLLREH